MKARCDWFGFLNAKNVSLQKNISPCVTNGWCVYPIPGRKSKRTIKYEDDQHSCIVMTAIS